MFWDELKYIPTLEDIEWIANVLRLVKDDGIIIFPATSLAYRVNKREHRLSLVNPDKLNRFDAKITHQRTIEVAKVVGYSVDIRPAD